MASGRHPAPPRPRPPAAAAWPSRPSNPPSPPTRRITTMNAQTETAAPVRQPGMGGDGRCMTCDSRQCGVDCGAQPGYVYAPGMGWVSPETATNLEALGRTVYWDD